MLAPYSWLRELVPLEVSAEELAERLTLTGLEVEGVVDPYEDLSPVVAVEVLSVADHPRAERLKVCEVSDGRERRQVVCGAPNVRPGLRTAYAPPGTVLFPGEKISTAEIRGVRSEGVLCSAYEIGLDGDRSGLLELAADVTPGTRLVEHFGLREPVLEVAVTPNRGDCLSILGLAREAAAVLELPFEGLPLPELPAGEEVASCASVSIEVPELCFRYAGRLLRGVRVGPSPFEVQKRLWLCGLRPINNVVDVTNYVLLEVGQPLHAFDFDLLRGRKVIVRLARDGEMIVTLDGEERRLDDRVMVIADAERPVAVAGIMGGEETAVSEATAQVFLESAWFNPSQIRRTTQRLRLSSESAYRFERGVDPEGVILGLERAAAMILALAGGEAVPGRLDLYPRPHRPPRIALRPRRVWRYLRVELSPEEVSSLLRRVGVQVERGEEGLLCTPPSHRHDLALEEDLIEEVARLHGYDRLPSTVPRAEIAGRPPARRDVFLGRVKALLVSLGLTEAINYSFISPRAFDRLGLPPDDPRRRVVRLANPLAETQSVMRTTLLPGLLETAQVNVFRERPDVAVFEVGRVFWPREGEPLPEERHHLGVLLTGLAEPQSCHGRSRRFDFFDLKGVLETLFARLGLAVVFRPGAGEPFLRPGVSAALELEGERVGFAGELARGVRERLDLPQEVWVAELDLERLLASWQEGRTYRPLPRFPATSRDLAMLVADGVPAEEILGFVRGEEVPYLEEVRLIDVYRGRGIPEGQKSLTLRFVYRAPDRTLTDEEVNRIQEEVSRRVLTRFEAQAR